MSGEAAERRTEASGGARIIQPGEWTYQRHGWLEAVRRDGDLNPMARLVAHVLALDFAHHHTARCNPGNEAVAAVLEVSPDTVKRAIMALVQGEWIVREPGRGRGRTTGFGFVTRAKVVHLKGGKSAPRKGGNPAPFYGSQKGADLHGKGGKSAPAYNKAEPYKNHRARESVEGTARLLAGKLRDGAYVPPSVFSHSMTARILDLGLLTRDELRAAGVDC